MSINPSHLCEGRLPSFVVPELLEDIPDTTIMCRLCMGTNESGSDQDLIEISSSNPHSDTPISQLFVDGLSINVDDPSSQGMPRKVCEDCLTQLQLYALFKRRALDCDTKLRTLVLRKQKLAEAQALYGPVYFENNPALHYSANATLEPLYFETVAVNGAPSSCISTLQSSASEAEQQYVKQFATTPNYEMDDIEATQSKEVGELHNFSVTTDMKGDEKRVNDVILDSFENLKETYLEPGRDHLSFNTDDSKSKSLNRHNVKLQETNYQISSTFGNSVGSDIVPTFVSLESSDENTSLIAQSTAWPNSRFNCNSKLSNVDAHFYYKGEKGNVPHHALVGREKRFPTREHRQVCKKNELVVPDVYFVETGDGRKCLEFKCPVCLISFGSRVLYRKHIHTHAKQKGSFCKNCDKWFPTSSSLSRHERIHSGERPYLCILCDRSFSQREILQRHVLTHADPKPFQCQYCDKNYTQKDGLASHIKHHHSTIFEIVQYQCSLCTKAFCHPSGLSRHMAMHSGKQFECVKCNRRFNDSSSLRRHIKKQHPVTLDSGG